MKKYVSILLILFLLSSCGKKNTQMIVEIPDENFKSYLLENFDADNDGKISLSEAKEVKEIDCSDRSIKSLNGIEKFVNLEKLNCSYNLIDELEITNIKKSKTLKMLICIAYNENTTFLEIPDGNFKSYLLETFDTNNQGKISLLEAKAIKEIDCSGRNIKSLKGIEKFVNLEYLNCSNNQLDELKVQDNKKLNRLVCNRNNMPLTVHVALSSSIINDDYRRSIENNPGNAYPAENPVNPSKCTYDYGSTNFGVYRNK